MLKVAICDDEVEQQHRVKNLFLHMAMNLEQEFKISCFSSGEELLEYYQKSERDPYHILILDIELRGINGIEVAKMIRNIPDYDVQIIFLTNYPEYVMDSFDVQAFQYLLKSVSYDVFEQKIIKLSQYIFSLKKRFLVIKVDLEEIVLKYGDIISLEVYDGFKSRRKLEITTVYDHYLTNGILSNYVVKLGDYRFLQIHRSIVVNMEHINKFTCHSVLMSNGAEFPIGRSKLKAVKATYTKYMISEFKRRS
ncbi:LytR/AlgR family response regulator transcription factor [Paenibacillus brasilensis]|uniref:DNA-binding LytR/AlgR family response regulator n=1 Tax=Paenibacillus brasilensis TaxID=128574 RepID=A0ABU0KYR2_9BACL|nr:LytTR family DNA-binding domain-containing protein [Paenibacillus brasilensis]MDQ0494583.1 DNA-binding LytR/AlgR family response regulator [Paenibacillus brasilensis]